MLSEIMKREVQELYNSVQEAVNRVEHMRGVGSDKTLRYETKQGLPGLNRSLVLNQSIL